MPQFSKEDLLKLWRPREDSSGEDNGQVTVIGGSDLFHGAPMFAVKAASRLVDMVFFASPERDLEKVTKLNSFIWIPWEDVDAYVAKSDAVLIGPGLKRFHSETNKDLELKNGNREAEKTKNLTRGMLQKFPDKKWIIDGGSLQTMEKSWIPKGSILTPNSKEFEQLFNSQFSITNFQSISQLYNCIIVYKGSTAYVADGETTYEIVGGNAGLTKGGTGDVLAGVIAGLAAKNPLFLAGAAGTYLVKKTAEELFGEVGYGFNADDLADRVFGVKKRLVGF